MAVLATLSATGAGCTFSDGVPWGQLDELTLSVALPVDDARLDEGRIRTSNDYAVEVRALQVHYSRAELTLASDEAAGFDPANPPDGCNNCHNGHCHCGDELVDYEVLSAESGVERQVAADLVLGVAGALVANETAAVPVTMCTSCELPRGEVDELRLSVAGVTLDVEVTELRTGDGARLSQPYSLSGFVLLDAVAAAAINARLDRDDDPNLAVSAQHDVSDSLFDGVDWTTAPTVSDEALAEALAAALTDRSNLQITLTRTP